MGRRLKQSEAARLTGLNQGYISRVLRGLTNPTVDVVKKLADAYDVSMGELLDHIAEKQAKQAAKQTRR